MSDNITEFPREPRRELFIGPFEEWRVVLDGRVIPLLTGRRQENGRIWLMLDHRFAGEFEEDAAWQAAGLIANALAIGQGYSSYNATSRDQPFAPLGMQVGPAPQEEPA